MSGICAVWRKDHPSRTDRTIASVIRGLALNAEDAAERAIDNAVGVGVSACFKTQMLYEDSRILVACDADLQNEPELNRLMDREAVSSTTGTAGLLAALYCRFGSDFTDRLSGSFSLVLWDRRERTLFAAVDRFGACRLVFYQDTNLLVIASRIDALMQCGEIDSEINPRAIANVLNYTASLAPETVFRNVHRLLPGNLLRASAGRTSMGKYWDMQYEEAGDAREGKLARELETLVERSVGVQCKDGSPGSVGAFLSGGTDSSTVVGMMARAGQTPRTFSIGFQEQPFNELGYAEIAAKKFQTEHHTYLVGADDCFEALPKMIRRFDEPFGNSSAIPTYFCARLAAQHGVKMLLAGDGGDELFGGNQRYATDKIFETYRDLPATLRNGLIEPVLAALPFRNGLVGKARSYVRRSNLPGLQRILSYHFLCAQSPASVFEGDFLKSLGGYSVLEIPSRYYAEAPAHNHLNRMLYADVKITLGDSDLPKVTTMSDLAGVQVRFPFLDRTVAEFSGSLPARLKVKGFQKRYLFKRAFRDLLPAEILAKKKHGFGIPVATWMRSDRRLRELARDTLFSARAFERGYIRREFIEDLFLKHEADESSYYGDTLWTFLVLELWHRQFVDQPSRVAV